MSDPVVEKVIQEIQSLSNDQLEEISRAIDEKLSARKNDNKQTNGSEIKLPFKPRIIGTTVPPPKDRSKEMAWLEKHRDEYAGQWVALDGDRLLSHGYKLKDVAAEAKAIGVMDALFIDVEPSDEPPYVGTVE